MRECVSAGSMRWEGRVLRDRGPRGTRRHDRPRRSRRATCCVASPRCPMNCGSVGGEGRGMHQLLQVQL